MFQLSKAESEARVMQEYRDLVKKGRDQFKKELESITPDIKLGQNWSKIHTLCIQIYKPIFVYILKL